MAGELRTSLNTFRFVKGAIDVSLPPVLANFDVAGTNYIRKTQTIGITDETLDLGDVATPGYLFLWNNDRDWETIGGAIAQILKFDFWICFCSGGTEL